MRARLGAWAGRYRGGLLAAAIIALGVALRVALVAAGWPGTDSDDSTMGLMALHILARGEHPIFFYGQAYMGTIEAYLGALMFALFGVSLFALKLGLIALYAGFMALMYLLLAGLFSRRWALAGLALLALGSDAQLFQQLNAYGGYLETLFFGALMVVLAFGLARGTAPFATRRARLVGYAAWGLAAGVGVWSDPLVSPFVAVTALLIVAFAPREARGRAGLLAALGLLVGVSPWLVYVASAHNPTAAASFLQHVPRATQPAPSRGSPPSAPPAPWQVAVLHVAGVVVVAVPDETGVGGLCSLANGASWPPDQWAHGSAACLAARGLWGAGYLALLALAIALEALALWRCWRGRRGEWAPDQRANAARSGSRLAALLAPAGTLLLFAVSSSSASFPWIFDRYLISLLIATPVMLASLWEKARAGQRAGQAGVACAEGERTEGGGQAGSELAGSELADESAPKGLAASKAAFAGSATATTPPRPAGGPHWGWEPPWGWGPHWGLREGWGVRSLALVALYGLMLATLLAGYEATVAQTPVQPAAFRVQNDLIQQLEAKGATRVYSEFWTCYRLIFLSDERVVCSVLNDDLSPRPSRWAPYDTVVAATPNPAYVFPVHSSQASTLLRAASQRGWKVSVTVVDGVYGIYRVIPSAGH